MQKNKKILILYAAIGLGHKSIAENIGYYLEKGGYEVKLMDVQKTQGGVLASGGKKIYQWMVVKFPGLWEWFYNTEWFISSTLWLRTKIASQNYKQVLNEISQFQPDAIISTHTTASAIISYLKSKDLFKGKFIIAFSDFHLHRYWLYENADLYLANIEQQKEQMVELGISGQKIFVCGITLKPKADVDIINTKNKFGVETDEKVALVSSGSQGFGVDETLIEKLLERPKTKVIVLCGSNLEGYKYLAEKFAGTNALILSYHQFMDELYAISDIFISKAGALSISEALNWQLPILVSHLFPGQEAHNYKYLLEKGLVMPKPINILGSALEEFSTGNFKKSISQNLEDSKLCNNGRAVMNALEQLI